MKRPTYTIVYDWNGTLLDDANAMLAALNVSLVQAAKLPPTTMAKLRKHYDIPLSRLYIALGLAPENIHETIFPITDLLQKAYFPTEDQIKLRKGVKKLLKEAQNNSVHQIVLSNHFISNIWQSLRSFKVDSMIAEVLANQSREHQKMAIPKAHKLIAYMKEHNLTPEHTIIVGDSPEETKIAKEMGLVSVSVTGGYSSKQRLAEVGPDHLIASPCELLPILKKRGFLA